MFLAIDLGTTGCRSILFDNTLKPLATAYREYGLITPQESYVEQDANLWWELTKETAKEAISKAGIDGKSVRSIAVSSQGITIVPVDEYIQPLCNAMSWLDTRAVAESKRIAEDFGEEYMFSLTGKPIDACYTLPKLLWLQTHLPHIYDATFKFLMPLDFLVAKFTGNYVTDHSMASGTLLYDLKKQCWSEQVLAHYGIDKARLPQIMQSSDVAGFVLPQVAEELGLSDTCTVAVGGQDQKCAAFGVGLKEDVMTVSLGTAAAITKLWKQAKTEQNTGVAWCGYVQEGDFVTEGVINTAGTCLRWVRDVLFPKESYDVLDLEAADALERGSSVLFHPFMNGPSAPSFYKQANGNFYGVNLSHKRGDFALAVMEGVAFQMRVLLETMDTQNVVDTLVLFGGGASSDLWCQIIADITGARICVPQTHEAAAAGAARLAANAVGDSVAPLTYAKTYLPSVRADVYHDKYAQYREIEKRLWMEET